MGLISPKFVCGAECGIAVTGTASATGVAAGVVSHWSSTTGATVSTTTFNSAGGGVRAFRCNPSASTAVLTHTFAAAIGSPATLVARFYVRFATLPNGDCRLFEDALAGGAGVYFQQSDSKIYAESSAALLGATGVAVTTGQWYRIDVKIVYATTATTDVSVNGVACGGTSTASANATSTGFNIGLLGAAVTADVFFDDIVVSASAFDFPIGEGHVVGLYPNGDKTNSVATASGDGNGGHLYSATTDFANGASGAVAVGNQNVEATSWQSLQNPLSTTIGSTWIADLTGTSSEHLVWTMTDLPADAASVNTGMLVATVHAASATSCTQSMWTKADTNTPVASDPSVVAQWSSVDLSEATITVPCALMGNFTVAQYNALLVQWGNASDVSPDPYCDGVCVEVDYLPYVRPTIVNPVVAVQRAGSW